MMRLKVNLTVESGVKHQSVNHFKSYLCRDLPNLFSVGDVSIRVLYMKREPMGFCISFVPSGGDWNPCGKILVY